MTARPFTKVSPNVWGSTAFRTLTADGQVLHFYFLSCPHQNSIGCFPLPDGYAVCDLGWTLERYRANRDALVGVGLVAFDPLTNEIFVRRWFQHSPVMNPSHRKSVTACIDRIQSAAIKDEVLADLARSDSKTDARLQSNVSPLLRTRTMGKL